MYPLSAVDSQSFSFFSRRSSVEISHRDFPLVIHTQYNPIISTSYIMLVVNPAAKYTWRGILCFTWAWTVRERGYGKGID